MFSVPNDSFGGEKLKQASDLVKQKKKKKVQFSVSFKHYVFLFSILINKGFFISIKTVEIILLSSLLCENMEEFHELDTF